MKLKIPQSKPRNPWVVAALHRNAGTHRRSNAAQRQSDRQALRRELHRQHLPSP